MKKNLVLWFLLMVLFLAACQTSAASEEDVETSLEGPDIASQLGTESVEGTDSGFKSASAAEAEVALVYTRSGGIAGISETYEFYTDGRIQVTRNGKASELRVAADEVGALLAELDTLGVLEKSARPAKLPGTGADLMTHTLTVQRGAGKPVTVSMTDGSSDLPDSLRDAFKAVNDLIVRASQQ